MARLSPSCKAALEMDAHTACAGDTLNGRLFDALRRTRDGTLPLDTDTECGCLFVALPNITREYYKTQP